MFVKFCERRGQKLRGKDERTDVRPYMVAVELYKNKNAPRNGTFCRACGARIFAFLAINGHRCRAEEYFL